MIVCALLTAVIGTVAAAQDDAEWERDVDALAPGDETATSLVVDALTRLPIPGARLTWYAEVEGLRAPALGTAISNAYGMATLDWEALATWNADGHFVVTAEGYAARHEYGQYPPDAFELVRGRDVGGRLVDMLGRPVADADIEVFLGCGHGPILDFVQTDADGDFTVRGQDADEAQLWVEAPGTQADYLDLSDGVGLGAGVRTFLVAPGGTAEGTVVDAAGRPIEGVFVRSFQAHRGPVGMTDRRGHFHLVGVEDDSSLYMEHPQAVNGWAILDGDGWRSGTPLQVTLTPWGFAEDDEDTVPVLARVLGTADTDALDYEIVVVRDGDGRAYAAAEDDDSPRGVLRLDLPPGLYVPQAAYAFGPVEIDPTPFDVRSGRPLRVTFNAQPRARLAVSGAIPDDAAAYVAVEGTAALGVAPFLDDEDSQHVPRSGPLVVAVEWLGRVFFFPAGETIEGVRTARVDLPAPHLLQLPPGVHGQLELLRDEDACEIETTDDGLITYASGDLELRIDTGDAFLRVPVSLPAEPGERIAIDVAPQAVERTLRVIPPEGTGDWMDIWITPLRGGGYPTHGAGRGVLRAPVTGPAWVRVERPDHVVWTRRVDGPGDVVVTWGAASLSFDVVDDGGDAVDVTALVDGIAVPQRDADDSSVLHVRGLTPGPHTVLLLPRDDDAFYAKEIRVVLDAGEERRRRVRLTLR